LSSLLEVRRRAEHSEPLNHQWIVRGSERQCGFGIASFGGAAKEETRRSKIAVG
jgi:hypothetical protein